MKIKKTSALLLLLFILYGLSGKTQIITTVVGNGTFCTFNGDSIPATSTYLDQVHQVTVDSFGNIYYSDYGCMGFNVAASRIRQVNQSTGLVFTLAGGGSSWANNIHGDSVDICCANGVAFDKFGNVYYSVAVDYVVRKISLATGIVTTVVGTGLQGNSGDSALAINATLGQPWGLATDTAGNLYIADPLGNCVRKVNTSTGIITTVAHGNAWYLALDSIGNIYFSDYQKIKKMTISTGIISTIAGTNSAGYNGDNILAINAWLNYPSEVAFDHFGNLYIADRNNSRIRKVDKNTGLITTVAGTGTAGYNGDNIPATSAEIDEPITIAIDMSGDLYIGGYTGSRIRKVIMSTNIYETNQSMDVSLYPNPTTSVLNISSEEKIKEIKIINVLGEIIYQSVIDKLKTTIDLSKIARGIYLICLTGNDYKKSTKKIIIQ